MKARAQKSNWSADVEILLMERQDRGYAYGTIVTMEYNEDVAQIIEPTFKMRYEEAQQLMDDLWQCGLRPSEGTGSAGALVATQKHLEDMRKLVFEGKHEQI